MSQYDVVIVAEGTVESPVETFSRASFAAAFCDGLERGAGLYGGGECYGVQRYEAQGDWIDDDVWRAIQRVFKANP